MHNRNKKEKTFNFEWKKNCIFNSIKEVNCFLSNLNNVCLIKKIIKKNNFH